MIERLARTPYGVYLLLAAYFLLNIAIRLSTPASLELDEGQQLYFAQWLTLGYGPQPPLYNWLQYGVVQLLGNSVAALTILKNSILFLTYLLFGLTAHRILRNPVLAVMATLGLFTIPQISYEAQRDLTHTVALLLAASLFIHGLVRSLQRPTLSNYALTGLAVGLGILSKYNFVLLPASALIALALDRDFRARLLDPRILATILVAMIVVAPHAIWLSDHIAEATSSTIEKLNRDEEIGVGRLDGLLSLTEAVAAISLPTLAVFFFAFGGTLWQARSATSQWTRLIGRILLIATLLLTAFVLSGSATYVRHRWLVTLFFLLPLYLAAKIEASGEVADPAMRRRFAIPVVAVMVFVPLLLLARPLWLAPFGYYSKQNVPYGPAIEAILASGKDRPSIVLAEDQQLAGNLRLHASDIPVIAPASDGLDLPFEWNETHPILAIWRDREDGEIELELDTEIREWLAARSVFPGQAATSTVSLPYHHGRAGDLYSFSYTWIYPGS